MKAILIGDRLQFSSHVQQDLAQVGLLLQQGTVVGACGDLADLDISLLRAVLVIQPFMQRNPEPLRFLPSLGRKQPMVGDPELLDGSFVVSAAFRIANSRPGPVRSGGDEIDRMI